MSATSLPDRSFSRATALPERLTDTMEKPALDNRSYRVIRLRNKLEALLIHDPDTDKASGALDVEAGSFLDSEDMPGMAHAVEHLLFMGTAKYPEENAYQQYLTNHSGYANAYTDRTSTNYYFEIAASAGSNSKSSSATSASKNPSFTSLQSSPLYGALDRFAQFFIAPLFLEDTLERELMAVDSENKKNLQNDTWRLHQLNKSLSNPKHPYSKFATGSYETLHDEPLARGVRIRDAFIDFHNKHYSANRMKLVVLGRETLDELEDWVEQLFSDVKDKDLPKDSWSDVEVYTDTELLTQVFAKPVMDKKMLDLYFPFMDEDPCYESQPGRYVSHLIGHEGPGSVMAYLKAKGWANGLGAGSMSICPGEALFTISIQLTEEGLKQYREVTKVVFQYISLLHETPPQEWVVKELMETAEIGFRFRQKSPPSKTASALSHTMQKPYPRDCLLSGGTLIRKYDPQAISEALSYLRSDNFRIHIISQDYPGDWDQREKWYGTEYRYEKIPQDFLAEIQKACSCSTSERPSELHLPPKNEFIPTRLDVERKDVEEPAIAPRLIRNDANVRLWYKKDDRFWVPKANVFLTLRSPLVNTTAQTYTIMSIYQDLVEDALNEYAYNAEIAGLNYQVDCHSTGLDINLDGYNDKMHVLLEKILVLMRDLDVRDDRFEIIRERLSRAYRNWDFQQPYQQIRQAVGEISAEKAWVAEDFLAELHQITADDVKAFFPQALRQAHIEILAHGNLYKEDALRIADLVEKIIKPRTLAPSQWPVRRALVLPSGSNYVYRKELKDPANINHCVEYLLFVCDIDDRKLRAKCSLMAQLFDEPAFNQLRTKEQLGYIVFSGILYNITVAGFRILIQSEKSCDYLEARIDSFLAGFGKTIEEMSDQDFESQKISLINKKLEKAKNLGQESKRFWDHIMSEYFDFNRAELDVECVEGTTKSEIFEFYSQYISPHSASRAKVSVHIIAKPSPTGASQRVEQMVGLMEKFLNLRGLRISSVQLRPRIENASDGEQEDIAEAVKAHMLDDLHVEPSSIEAIVEEARPIVSALSAQGGPPPATGPQELLQAVIAHLVMNQLITAEELMAFSRAPSKSSAASDTKGAHGGETVVPAIEPVAIKDVRAFKASMMMSKGARPVQDLSTFEETDPKL